MVSLFNFLARVVGIIFFIGGCTMGIYGLTHHNNDNPWFMIVLAFILAILGLLMVFARPYRPDNDDE
jgi:uncharacterized membrane protein HdeD (DUF308 family)